jgi:hypothetical protein
MPATRTATATPAAFYVPCPHCQFDYVCPATGSYMIGRDSVVELERRGTPGVGTCGACGKTFKLPAVIMRTFS